MPRVVTLLVLMFALASLQPQSGIAQPYPTKPIKLIVPQAPGGQMDVIARILGQRVSEMWNQQVVIENHGGAGGTIGADLVAKAPADGYTLLLGGLNNLVLAVALIKDLRYDPTKDFVSIGGLAYVPYALAVHPSVPATTVSELVAYAKAFPGRLTYGSSGIGSTSSLAAELLKSKTGVNIVHVPYKGSAPAVQALVRGDVDIMFADLSLLAPHARVGALRLVAAAGAQRAPAAPELATVAEEGVAGFAIEPWYGLLAPAGTPPEALAKLRSGLSQVVRRSEVRRRFEQLGYELIVDTPAQLGELIRSDIEKYSAVIKAAGIKVDP